MPFETFFGAWALRELEHNKILDVVIENHVEKSGCVERSGQGPFGIAQESTEDDRTSFAFSRTPCPKLEAPREAKDDKTRDVS